MDYEKAYKEAIKRAKAIIEVAEKEEEVYKSAITIFPELKESEDEKIRKELIKHLKDGVEGYMPAGDSEDYARWLAWVEKQQTSEEAMQYLKENHSPSEISDFQTAMNIAVVKAYDKGMKVGLEKQGEKEQKKTSIWKHWSNGIVGNGDGELIYLIKLGNKYSLSSCIGCECDYIELSDLDKLLHEKFEMKSPEESLGISSEEYNDIVNECLYGVSNSSDKEEPKFNIDDWITNGDYTWKIVEVKPLDYILQSQDGNIVDDTISHVDEQFHLWTINDAKDGDVLADDDNNIFIFDGTVEKGKYPFAYCGLTAQGFDSYDIRLPFTHDNNIHPATWEQRNLLFKKMKEAGYEWDSEKKEQKEIDPKPYGQRKECLDCQFNYVGECKGSCQMKRDEQKPILDFKAKDWYVSKVDGKIRNIYHSVDKVEPKFNVGDWVADNNGKVAIIYDLQKTGYVGHYTDGTDFICKYSNEYLYHLWTIQDAKDGDMLATDKSVFIYAKVLYSKPYAYCGVDKYGVFKDNCLENNWANSVDNIHPATKEQRELLFQKMKEAGYEWNAEKKELKKISQRMISAEAKEALYDKPTDEEMKELLRTEYEKGRADVISEMKSSWSEEDEKTLNEIFSVAARASLRKSTLFGKSYDYIKWQNWLKSLRPQNNITDEELAQAKKDAYNDALDKIEYHSGEPTFDDGWSAAIWYLKKKNAMPQNTWKPSNEQMEAFEHFVRSVGESGYASPYDNNTKLLYSLLEQLKKLSEK